MNRTKFVFSFAWVVALLVAIPVAGQLVGFPVTAVPYSRDGDSRTAVAATFTRGLNSDSGENDGFAASGVRSMEQFSVSVGVAYVRGDIDEATFGGQASYHLLEGNNSMVSIQAGIGYLSLTDDPLGVPLVDGSLTTLNFPIGLALQARPSEYGRIWVMPRFQLSRVSDDVTTNTFKDFGVSLGASISSEGGLGIHAAFDFVDFDNLGVGSSPIGGSVGLHYILPN